MKNPAAVALGKLGAGHPKHYTAAELERRRKRLAVVREAYQAGRRAAKAAGQAALLAGCMIAVGIAEAALVVGLVLVAGVPWR